MSIEQGLLVVLVVSLLFEAVVCAYCPRGFRFLMAVLVPFIASVSLYWLPNLGHLHDAEFRDWFGLFLVVWFVPSAAACTVAAIILTWLRCRRDPMLMNITFGRAKHMDKITLQDCLRYPIWVSAHDDRHDEESQKPITSTSDVTEDVLQVDRPIITFKVEGQECYGSGHCDHQSGQLYAMALWIGDKWIDLEIVTGLETPIQLIAVPKILGLENVQFTLKDTKDGRAYQAA